MGDEFYRKLKWWEEPIEAKVWKSAHTDLWEGEAWPPSPPVVEGRMVGRFGGPLHVAGRKSQSSAWNGIKEAIAEWRDLQRRCEIEEVRKQSAERREL